MGLFTFGLVTNTPAALTLYEKHQILPLRLLGRHLGGDWGDTDLDDAKMNENAIVYDDRILSSYRLGDERVWVITEEDRSSTCLLLPEEY